MTAKTNHIMIVVQTRGKFYILSSKTSQLILSPCGASNSSIFKIVSTNVKLFYIAIFFIARIEASPKPRLGKLITLSKDTSSLGFKNMRRYEIIFLISTRS